MTNRQGKEPIPGLLTDAERDAEPIEFPDETATGSENPGAVEASLDEFYAAEASMKIVMRKTAEEQQTVAANLANADAKVGALVKHANNTKDSSNEELRAELRAELRSLVSSSSRLVTG